MSARARAAAAPAAALALFEQKKDVSEGGLSPRPRNRKNKEKKNPKSSDPRLVFLESFFDFRSLLLHFLSKRGTGGPSAATKAETLRVGTMRVEREGERARKRFSPLQPKGAAAAVAASPPRVVVPSSVVPRARPRGLAESRRRCGAVAHSRVAEVEALPLLLLEGNAAGAAKCRRGERCRGLRRSCHGGLGSLYLLLLRLLLRVLLRVE